MKIGIVGLGLMGGSLGLALKHTKLVSSICGYDYNLTHCKEALELGLVSEIVSFEEIKQCDVIVLAIPVEGIIKALKSLEDVDQNTTIIDLGSTKEQIINSVPKKIRKNFVAGHPMAGTEKFGPKAAIEGLYDNAVMVFCNLESSGDLHKQRAIQLFSHIGMKVFFMDATNHDRHASFISHLPHALSYALARSVMNQEDPKSILILAGGGFEDMSRIAKSSPRMWSDIFKQNKNNLLKSIDVFQEELEYSKKLIKDEKWDELSSWMHEATKLHNIL
ncbi:MAG: prephenate dehydrogenase [Proteobacteria bacterium]|nr:MAG: prephenate dehydrogenase [Pseudomonadota bacterium]